MKYLGVILSILSLILLANAKDFIASFGNGGITDYKIIDNTCSVYVINYEKIKNSLPQALNQMVMASIKNARKAYKRQGDGYINISTSTQVINEKIIYQVCGDIIRRK